MSRESGLADLGRLGDGRRLGVVPKREAAAIGGDRARRNTPRTPMLRSIAEDCI